MIGVRVAILDFMHSDSDNTWTCGRRTLSEIRVYKYGSWKGDESLVGCGRPAIWIRKDKDRYIRRCFEGFFCKGKQRPSLHCRSNGRE